MDIRSPLPPDDDDRVDNDGLDGVEPTRPAHPPQRDAEADGTPVDRLSFVVPTRVIVAKFGVAAIIALIAGFAPQPSQLALGLLAATAVAGYAGRDLLARERLRADAGGLVVVRGYAGRTQLSWADVERLQVDTRARLGTRTATLEVDAGEHIYFFTRNDLGVDPDDALSLLEKVRAG